MYCKSRYKLNRSISGPGERSFSPASGFPGTWVKVPLAAGVGAGGVTEGIAGDGAAAGAERDPATVAGVLAGDGRGGGFGNFIDTAVQGLHLVITQV